MISFPSYSTICTSFMDTNFNYVKCSKCEHDRNPSTAKKCEICGKALHRGSSPLPLLGLGLVTVVALGAGAFVFKDKLPGFASSSTSSSATVATSSSSPESNSSAQPPQPSASSSTSNPQIQGAVVDTYQRLADVQNVPQGTFNYGGSTTFAPLRSPEIVSAMSQAFPQLQLRYSEPTTGQPGSGKGIEMLIDGQLSFSQSSRAVKDEEFARAKNRGFALEQVPVAIDGIAIYVNPTLANQGLQGLSLAQIRDVFTGKIQNWKELGGPDLKITPYSRNLQAGGTVDFFHEGVLEKQPLGRNLQEVRDTTEALRRVARDPGGISYATASEVINQQTIRLIGVAKETNQPFASPCADASCTTVNNKAFLDSSYPITRRLFVIIKRDGKLDEQAGVAYANMLLSDEGQKLTQQAGFVSIR